MNTRRMANILNSNRYFENLSNLLQNIEDEGKNVERSETLSIQVSAIPDTLVNLTRLECGNTQVSSDSDTKEFERLTAELSIAYGPGGINNRYSFLHEPEPTNTEPFDFSSMIGDDIIRVRDQPRIYTFGLNPLPLGSIIGGPLFFSQNGNRKMSQTKIIELLNTAGETIDYKTLTSELQLNCKSCPICSDDFKDDTKIFVASCIHIFCFDCICAWVGENKNNCPICRDIYFNLDF
jgi:hypothetical protein